MTTDTVDVLIIGGGIFGLCAAFSCVKRRLSVTVIDAGKIGGGASGGVVGALAPYVPDEWNQKRAFQLRALLSAPQFWAEVDGLSGLSSGYGRIGRVLPLVDPRQKRLAELRHYTAKLHWPSSFGWTLLEEHPSLSRELAPFGVVHETMSARLFPACACRSLQKACTKLGVKFHENQHVESIFSGGVTRVGGAISAKKIIVAGGAVGFKLLNEHVGMTTGVGVKGQAALLDIDLGESPQVYANGIYIVPHENGTTAVGSTSEETWNVPFETDEKLDALIERASTVCPELRGAKVIQKWAGLRPKARRREPMLGPVPNLKGVFAATGGFKIGFGLAHEIGEVMADYVTDRSVELPRNFNINWHLS